MIPLSICIPTWKGEAFIAEAIRSVLAQTWADFELIVCDDGSTDGTGEYLRSLNLPIRYIYQENAGVSTARNRGFAECSGQYVLFLDSDDYLLPKALETLSTIIKTNDDQVIARGDSFAVDRDKNVIGKLSEDTQLIFGETIESYIVSPPTTGLHSYLYPKYILASIEGPFDEQMNRYEDCDLVQRLRMKGYEITFTNEVVCCYRFHGKNNSAVYSKIQEKREQSLLRNRLRILNSPIFNTFSLSARVTFFYSVLDHLADGSFDQRLFLEHKNFLLLPAKIRARYIHYLAIEKCRQPKVNRREVGGLWLKVIGTNLFEIRPYIYLFLLLIHPRLVVKVNGIRQKLIPRKQARMSVTERAYLVGLQTFEKSK